MATIAEKAAEQQVGHGRRRRSFWARIVVPPVRVLLLAGAAIACWRTVRDVKPRKQSAPAEIRKIPDIPRMRSAYAFSLIPGGISSDDDLEAARASDPLLAAHYADVGFLRPAFLTQDRLFYASYRQGSSIVWTSSRIPVRAGESILADRSGNLIRGRCGNRLSEQPRLPVGFVEPPHPIFETPQISFAPDITLPESSNDQLAGLSIPSFPSIEAPAPAPNISEIPTTFPVPPESPLEPAFDDSFVFGPWIPPPAARPLAPYKIPPREPDKPPAAEPDTARMLMAAILLAIFFKAGSTKSTADGR